MDEEEWNERRAASYKEKEEVLIEFQIASPLSDRGHMLRKFKVISKSMLRLFYSTALNSVFSFVIFFSGLIYIREFVPRSTKIKKRRIETSNTNHRALAENLFLSFNINEGINLQLISDRGVLKHANDSIEAFFGFPTVTQHYIDKSFLVMRLQRTFANYVLGRIAFGVLKKLN